MKYEIQLTPEAQNDLRIIFEYIAHDLQSVQNAACQLDRLEKGIVFLHQMPEHFSAYDKEPWRSRNLRIMPVDNYLFFTFLTMIKGRSQSFVSCMASGILTGI